jgi:hypothetical protein
VRSIFQDALSASAVRCWASLTVAFLVGCTGGSLQTPSQTPVVTKGAIVLATLPAVSALFRAGAYPPNPLGGDKPQGNGKFVTTLQAYGSDADVYQVTTTHRPGCRRTNRVVPT